jgi:hypothetical protein
MKHWYQKPHHSISEYIKTVLILEGFSESPAATLPLFTNGMPALFCRTEKGQTEIGNIVQLTLFGKSIPQDCWEINIGTTVIAYFFKPFALAGIFNISAAKLLENPIDLCNWSPHKPMHLERN